MGRNATGLMQSSGVKNIIELLSILGMFMMSVLAGNYVKVSSSLAFDISGRPFVLQDTLIRYYYARSFTISGCFRRVLLLH